MTKSYALAMIAILAATATAQPPIEPKDGKVTYTMTISPTAAPKPASKYYLLPEYRDSIEGNRVQMFLRCFMEQDHFFGFEQSQRREKLNLLPLSELPKGTDQEGGRLVSRDMYDAARMTRTDWQLAYFMRRDGIGTRLPDVQKFRSLAQVLKTRVRGEIAIKDFPAALRSLQTLFSHAQTMEAHPTCIGSLVGLAIESEAINAIQEMIAQPGCPNLYWSLSDLPAPLLDLRQARQGERLIVSEQFKSILNATEILTDKQMYKVIDDISDLARYGEGVLEKPSVRYAFWSVDAKRLAVARERLIQYGMKPTLVKQMSGLQVAVTDDLFRMDVYRDEFFKWINLPPHQAYAGLVAAEAELQKQKKDLVLAPIFIPAIVKVLQSRTRLQQRVDYLRVIEAIRLYAFENDGKLPATLDAIPLPIPLDPVTGKPFSYTVKADTATLTGGNPSLGTPTTNRSYEIQIRK